MYWHTIVVEIRHDLFDVISLLFSFVLGVVAIISLWISRKALQKSEWDSAMSTSPSIVIRPNEIKFWTKHNKTEGGYNVHGSESLINSNVSEIAFVIKFECFNAGRGVAFNISQPKILGMDICDYYDRGTPLYQTKEDDSFELMIWNRKTFKEFCEMATEEIPVTVSLVYTNDQNTVFCRSTWSANVKPFDIDGENLKSRKTSLFKRNGKIEYSETPYRE
jgi:hypothetical protein